MQQACVVHTAPDTILVSEKQMTEAELNTAVSDVTMLLKTGKLRRTIISCVGFCCTMLLALSKKFRKYCANNITIT